MKRRTPEAEPATSTAQSITSAAPLSAALQAVISVLIALHLLSVFIAPLSFATDNGSPAVAPVHAVLQPYIDLLYLRHGYAFFAPNPGANHLVHYELEFNDSREAIVGDFPDLKTQRPRLLYHRHFMLAETLNTMYQPPFGPPEPRQPSDSSRRARRIHERQLAAWTIARDDWQSRRELYESLRKSIGDHLKHAHGASDVVLIRREHRPLAPVEISEDRLRLTDQETYQDLPEAPAAEVLPWNPVPTR